MADIKDSDKPAEPTPAPNQGVSVPQDTPLSQAPLVDGIVQAADDAISGKNAAAINDVYTKAAMGDPTAQAQAASQSLGNAMVGSLHTNVPAAQGLAQKAEEAMGVAPAATVRSGLQQAEALWAQAQQALAKGEITPEQAEAVRQRWQTAMRVFGKSKYAEGGEVSDPSAAFDNAFQPLPSTPDQMAATYVPTAQAIPTPAVPEQAPSGPINVINPEGKLVSLPAEQLQDALAAGYTHATPEHIAEHIKQEKYGTMGQQIATGLEGAAEAGTFGLSTGAERALGVSPEDIQGRREVNPGVHAIGQLGGLAASALTGVGEAAALGRLGEATAGAVGLAAPISTMAKIGSTAVKAAIENAAFTGGDEVSRLIAGDPHQSIESAVTDIGLSGLLGAGVGGAIGSVNPLWQATMGAKTSGLLHAIQSRLGGVEGAVVSGERTAIDHALEVTGLGETMAPEVRAALSSDPAIQRMASTLEQSDTTASGTKFQEAMKGARREASEVQAQALGSNLDDIPSKGDIDKYTTGKSIGDTLANEYNQRIAPLAEQYEGYAQRFKDKPLATSIADKAEDVAEMQDEAFGKLQKAQRELSKALKSQDPSRAIEAEAGVRDAQAALRAARAEISNPGVVDGLQQSVANLITREKYNLSPSSDIMRELARVQKDLTNIKSLEDLSAYTKIVGENMKSQNPLGLSDQMSRAGGQVKQILREAESAAIESHLGPEELVSYRQTQQQFAAAAKIKDAIQQTLGAKGSVTNYGKAIKAMAADNGEAVLRKLSGQGDAAWLDFVRTEFPETAQLIKGHHIDSLLAAAKDVDGLSSKKLLSAMDKMSPQLRDFALDATQQGKVKAAAAILEQLSDKTHNFSNTARTIDKLTQHTGGVALGLVSALTGHGAATSVIVGALGNLLGKTAPDAARLALLKFLGSTGKIDSGALKVAADLIGKTVKGEALITKAAKNVFKDGAEILPESKMPTEAMRDKLDKKLLKLQDDPTPLLDVSGKTGHYMPEHGAAMSEVSARVVNYVNANRPIEQRLGALDPPMPPTDAAKDKFARILDIAQQPLVVLEHIKNGTILPDDVVALKSMYPKMYDNLVSKLTNAMTEHVSGESEVSYQTRIGLSLFMGQPLDATMTPSAIQAAQPIPPQAPSPQAQGQPKHSTAKLSKLPNQFMTPDQAREADKLKK